MIDYANQEQNENIKSVIEVDNMLKEEIGKEKIDKNKITKLRFEQLLRGLYLSQYPLY